MLLYASLTLSTIPFVVEDMTVVDGSVVAVGAMMDRKQLDLLQIRMWKIRDRGILAVRSY